MPPYVRPFHCVYRVLSQLHRMRWKPTGPRTWQNEFWSGPLLIHDDDVICKFGNIMIREGATASSTSLRYNYNTTIRFLLTPMVVRHTANWIIINDSGGTVMFLQITGNHHHHHRDDWFVSFCIIIGFYWPSILIRTAYYVSLSYRRSSSPWWLIWKGFLLLLLDFRLPSIA